MKCKLFKLENKFYSQSESLTGRTSVTITVKKLQYQAYSNAKSLDYSHNAEHIIA